MNHQWQSSPGQYRECLSQIGFAHIGKLIYAGRCEKAFERSHACACKRLDVTRISGNDPADKFHIHDRLRRSALTLYLERLDTRSRRNGIERHVENRRHSARRRRSRGCRESFPFGTTWLIYMHVRVDYAWHHNEVSRLGNWRAVRHVIEARDALDPAACDMN
jgi:hypothetical protein